MESHVHIKENPKASTRCDGQSLSFLLYQNAGYLFTCRLPLDKSCNIKNGVYYEKRYCCGEVSAPVCKPKMSRALSIVLQGLTLSVFTMILLALGFKRISFLS